MRNPAKAGPFLISLCFVMGGAGFAAAEIPVQHADAEILGVLSMIDQNQIQAAQLAEQKNIDHKVLDYAKNLDIDHNKHLNETKRLSQELGLTIPDNNSIDNLRDKGEEDIAALTALDATAFSQLYIADMIKGHSEVLNWIDNQEAENPQVKKFLRETQETINLHLQEAQRIQEQQQIGQS